MKVVINDCFGGFSLSKKAVLWMREKGSIRAMNATVEGETYHDGSGPMKAMCGFDGPHDIRLPDEDYDDWEWRSDPVLIQCVETLKGDAGGPCSELRVVTIPDDVEWAIEEYDGAESIHEVHRRWS